MESPCYLLNNETLHPDAVNDSLTQCQQFYDDMILGELQEFCPKMSQDPSLIRNGRSICRNRERPKRFVLVAIGVVLGVVVLTFGLAVGSLVKSIKNANNIEDLEQRNNKMNKMMRELEKQLDIREESFRFLEKSVGQLAIQTAAHEQDFLRMKQKLSSSMFIVSYVMSRLMLGQQTLKTANRLWKDGKLSEEMFDFFNITLPCENCRIKLSNPISCSMTNDRRQVYLRISVPVENKDVHVLKADAFKLMARTNLTTCSLSYVGPPKLIVNLKNDCTYAINSRYTSDTDLSLIPKHGCRPGRVMPNNTKYFAKDHCVKRQEGDEKDFVQVKLFIDRNIVFCPERIFEVNGRSQLCPDLPFYVPANVSFKINNVEYQTHRLYVEQQVKVDPLLTFRANHDLSPKIRLDEIIEDIQRTEKALSKADEHRITDFDDYIDVGPSHYIAITLSILLLILIIGFVVYHYQNKRRKMRGRITIRARRKMPEPEGETEAAYIDLEDVSNEMPSAPTGP